MIFCFKLAQILSNRGKSKIKREQKVGKSGNLCDNRIYLNHFYISSSTNTLTERFLLAFYVAIARRI